MRGFHWHVPAVAVIAPAAVAKRRTREVRGLTVRGRVARCPGTAEGVWLGGCRWHDAGGRQPPGPNGGGASSGWWERARRIAPTAITVVCRSPCLLSTGVVEVVVGGREDGGTGLGAVPGRRRQCMVRPLPPGGCMHRSTGAVQAALPVQAHMADLLGTEPNLVLSGRLAC